MAMEAQLLADLGGNGDLPFGSDGSGRHGFPLLYSIPYFKVRIEMRASRRTDKSDIGKGEEKDDAVARTARR